VLKTTFLPHYACHFEGELACYARLSIGRIVGAGAVRALCLTFSAGTLVTPVFSELEQTDLFHVPVFAVQEISKST
jgi:hypothetical protein